MTAPRRWSIHPKDFLTSGSGVLNATSEGRYEGLCITLKVPAMALLPVVP